MAGEWFMNSLMVTMGFAPLAALSVIAGRWRRGGWWIAAPWLLLTGLWLVLLRVFYSLGIIGSAPGRLGEAVVGTGVFAAWLTLSIFLVALIIVGPKLPPPGLVRRK